MKPLKIVAVDTLFGIKTESEVLKELNCEITIVNKKENPDLIWWLRDADAVIVNGTVLNEKVINAMTSCKVISRYGVGYDNIAWKRAFKKGIQVAFVPSYCQYEVAEHSAALLLACARNITQKNTLIKNGGWKENEPANAPRISGSTLGIIGYGQSGKKFHKMMSGFGFSSILIHSRSLSEESPTPDSESVDLETLLINSDYISLHLPHNEKTHHMINQQSLGMMKDGVVLINSSRGKLIDEEALYQAIISGKVRAAGLDVFEQEPPNPESPLIALPQVIATNHFAYYSNESVELLKKTVAENILSVFKTGKPIYSVADRENIETFSPK